MLLDLAVLVLIEIPVCCMYHCMRLVFAWWVVVFVRVPVYYTDAFIMQIIFCKLDC